MNNNIHHQNDSSAISYNSRTSVAANPPSSIRSRRLIKQQQQQSQPVRNYCTSNKLILLVILSLSVVLVLFNFSFHIIIGNAEDRLIGQYFSHHHQHHHQSSASESSEKIQKAFETILSTKQKSRHKAQKIVRTSSSSQLTNYSWFSTSLVQVLHRETPFSNITLCVLSILHTENCRDEESFEDCLERLAVTLADFESILPQKCIDSQDWKDILSLHHHNNRSDKSTNKKLLSRGMIPDSTIFLSWDKKHFIIKNVDDASVIIIKPSPFGPPIVCKNPDFSVYPIGFGIPSSIIMKEEEEEGHETHLQRKNKVYDFMPSLPKMLSSSLSSSSGREQRRHFHEFTIAEESAFREMLSRSYFAFVSSRYGWDSLRLYEILASGAIPYFVDAGDIPGDTLTHLPKKLLREILSLTGLEHVRQNHNEEFFTRNKVNKNRNNNNRIVFKKPGAIDWSTFNTTQYSQISRALLQYTREYLSCSSVAKYLLSTILQQQSSSPKRKILLISEGDFNYMDRTIFVGLTELGYDLGKYLFVASTSDGSYGNKGIPALQLLYDDHYNQQSESERGRYLKNVTRKFWGHGMSFVARGKRYRGRKTSSSVLYGDGIFTIDDNDDSKQKELVGMIKSGKFDTFIFTFIPSPSSKKVFTDLLEELQLMTRNKSNKIAFVDSADIEAGQSRYWNSQYYEKLSRIGTVFAREIDRDDMMNC